MDSTDELDFLYELIATCHRRIQQLVKDGQLDVTWKGIAEFEQRCYLCGLWINTGDPIAAIRVSVLNDSIQLKRYVHERCLTSELTDPRTSVQATG